MSRDNYENEESLNKGKSHSQGKGKNAKANSRLKPKAALYGLICVIIGIIDLVNPEKMLNIIAYALGISAIVCGVVYVIMYLVRDIRHNLDNNDFLGGLIAIVAGIVILLKWQEFMSILPVILGALIVVSGCIKLQDCIDLKKLEHPMFGYMLILALVFIIFGGVLVANPFKTQVVLMRVIGVTLIISGMTDLFVSVFFDSIKKKYMEDIETTYEEVD